VTRLNLKGGISFRLEEPIRIPYCVVGTPEWFREAIPADFPEKSRVVVSASADLDAVRAELRREAVLAVDTESSGPRPKDGLDAVSPSSEIVLAQIGTRRNTYLIEPKLLGEFRPILESTDTLKLLQNAVHDFRFLWKKADIHLMRIYCTMLAEQVVTAGFEGRGVGFADLVRKYPPYRLVLKDVRSEFIRFSGRFSRDMLYYGARDVFALFDVFDAQRQLLIKNHLEKTARLEFNVIPTTAEMVLSGVLLDPAYLNQTIAYYRAKQDACAQAILDLYNEEMQKRGYARSHLYGYERMTFNLSSGADKKHVLAQLGIKVDDVEYETMKRIEHPMGDLFADWSANNKVLTSYGEALLARRHWSTGRIHPRFDQLGSGEEARHGGKDKKETISTGRMSGDFQQLPRPETILVPVEGAERDRVEQAFAATLADLRQEAARAAA
jgi:DNA polymerase I-like protein with 3'-5' exonuclease and polymerase domains